MPRVSVEIDQVFDAAEPEYVVASAACGTDLLVLDAARARGIPYLVVLPFPRASFRERSVADCPGTWLRRFDAVLDDPPPGSRLTVLGPEPTSDAMAQSGYAAATRAIVEAAARRGGRVTALIAWEGQAKEGGGHDETAAFRSMALENGWGLAEVITV